MPDMEQHAFTTTSNCGILMRLTNTVTVHGENSCDNFVALWDTGATTTCISKGVASKLSLMPTGECGIQHASGSSQTNTYLVSITLPNDVKINNIMVCEADLDCQGIGVLIGMDIITMGDLSVTNHNGNTMFSFQVPSSETIDYVKKINARNLMGTHGVRKHKKKK